MNVISYIIVNPDEISYAEKLNLPKKVEPIIEELEVLIAFDSIALAFLIKPNNELRIRVVANGKVFALKYNEALWERIKVQLNKSVAYLIDNSDDIIEAMKQGISIDPKFSPYEVYYPIWAIGAAFIFKQVEDYRIKIFISGEELVLHYDEESWTRIKKKLLYA